MARIELRDCIVRLKDGLAGAAAINMAEPAPATGATSLTINSVVLNSNVTSMVPVGARFTIASETGSPVHTVTARTPADEGPTTSITFTPATAAGVVNLAVLTFMPQQLEIKIGDGNLSYTEHNEYEYLLDRGDLDTVKGADEVPMDVRIDCVYEHITTGTGENVSPMDALKGIRAAKEWVSAAEDLCEPYAVDIELEHIAPCGTSDDEITIFPDFRSENREISLKDSTISVTGKCNAVEPIVDRRSSS